MLTNVRALPATMRHFIRGACFLIPFWIWAVFFLSGFARWPYAPISAKGAHYFDKRGTEISSESYGDYERWESNRYRYFGIFIAFGAYVGSSLVVGLPILGVPKQDDH